MLEAFQIKYRTAVGATARPEVKQLRGRASDGENVEILTGDAEYEHRGMK